METGSIKDSQKKLGRINEIILIKPRVFIQAIFSGQNINNVYKKYIVIKYIILKVN